MPTFGGKGAGVGASAQLRYDVASSSCDVSGDFVPSGWWRTLPPGVRDGGQVNNSLMLAELK